MFETPLMRFRAQLVINLVGWIFVPHFFCSAATCPPPDLPEGGSYRPEKLEYKVGQTITYSCPGRLLRATYQRRTCESTGAWSGVTPFCDSQMKIKNMTASSGIDGEENPVNPQACHRTEKGTEKFITISLERPMLIFAVVIGSVMVHDYGSFRIYVSKNKNTSLSEKTFCRSYDIGKVFYMCIQFYCKDTDVEAEFITLHVLPGAGEILVCDVKVYAKLGEFCAEPPENSIANGHLEVGRNRTILKCKKGFKEKNNNRVYGTCKRGQWIFKRLQCIEGVCDPYIGSTSLLEGVWETEVQALSVGAKRTLKCNPGYYTSGEPLTVTCLKNGTWTNTTATCKKEIHSTDYKVLATVLGSVLIVVKLCFMCVAIYLKQRKKPKDVVVVYEGGETNVASELSSTDEKTREKET